MELVNIVADSRYRLYDDFISGTGVAGNNGRRRLGEYLGAVRQAFVAGLEKGGSDPFRTITSAASM
jgi:nuclear pore complex protein Nup107